MCCAYSFKGRSVLSGTILFFSGIRRKNVIFDIPVSRTFFLLIKGLVNEDMNLDLNSLDLNPPNNLISNTIVHKKSIYSLILELCSFFFNIPPMTTRGWYQRVMSEIICSLTFVYWLTANELLFSKRGVLFHKTTCGFRFYFTIDDMFIWNLWCEILVWVTCK